MSEGRERTDVPAQGYQAGHILSDSKRGQSLFDSDLQLIGWDLPTLGRVTCFTQSIKLNVKVIQKHLHKNTQNNAWQISGDPMAQLYWCLKLTISVHECISTKCDFLENWVRKATLSLMSNVSVLFSFRVTSS
jgi:hypothetical protein